jgi:hypothetical protein
MRYALSLSLIIRGVAMSNDTVTVRAEDIKFPMDASPAHETWLQAVADNAPFITGIYLLLTVICGGYWGHAIGGGIGAAECGRIYSTSRSLSLSDCDSYTSAALLGAFGGALVAVVFGLLQAAAVGMLHGIYVATYHSDKRSTGSK